MSAVLEPVLGAAAAIAVIVAPHLPAGRAASVIVPGLSGALWTASGVAREVGNALSSRVLTSANVLNVVAGVSDTANVYAPRMSLARLSAATWALSGSGKILRAVGDAGRNCSSRALEIIAGATTIVAAGLAWEAAEAARRQDAARSGAFGTASNAMWLAAELAGLASVAATRRSVPRDEEAGPGMAS